MTSPPVRSRTPSRRSPSRRSPAASTAGSSESGAVTDTERKTPIGNGTGFGAAAGGGAGAGGGGGADRAGSAVRVVVRVRPQNKKEIEAGGTVCVAFPSEVCLLRAFFFFCFYASSIFVAMCRRRVFLFVFEVVLYTTKYGVLRSTRYQV